MSKDGKSKEDNSTNYTDNSTNYNDNSTNYTDNSMNCSYNLPDYNDNTKNSQIPYDDNKESNRSISAVDAQVKRKVITTNVKKTKENYVIPSIVNSKVDSSDLQNGFLLNPEQIEAAQRWFKENNEVRIRKNANYELNGNENNTINLPFSVIKSEQGDLFALYYGANQNKELGKGSFGTVKLAQNLSSGEWAAIKIQRHKAKDNNANLDSEKEKLNRAEQFLGSQSITTKDDEYKKEIIVMPIGGSSFEENQEAYAKKVNDIGSIENPDERFQKILELALFSTTAAYSTMQNLKELHDSGMIHRDLHTGNILVDDKGNATIIDFGLAALAASNESISSVFTPHSTRGIITIGRGDIHSPEIRRSINSSVPHQFTFKDDAYASSLCIREYKTLELLHKHGKALQIPEHELKNAENNLIRFQAGISLQTMANLPEDGDPVPGTIYINKNSDFIMKDKNGQVINGKLNANIQLNDSKLLTAMLRDNVTLNRERSHVLKELKNQGIDIEQVAQKDRPSIIEMKNILERMNHYVKLQNGLDLTKASSEEIKEYFELAKRVNNGLENSLNPLNGMNAITVNTTKGKIVGNEAMAELSKSMFVKILTDDKNSKVSDRIAQFEKLNKSQEIKQSNPLLFSRMQKPPPFKLNHTTNASLTADKSLNPLYLANGVEKSSSKENKANEQNSRNDTNSRRRF